MTQYSERDIKALDRQGNYYSRHVSAMTGEGLHDKSDIAAELAWRDARIDALAAHVERCRDVFSGLSEYWNGCEGMAAENAAQNAMDVACDMLEELPETSLARLKAEWQAEAFDHPLITPDMKAGCIGEFEVEVDHSCTACHFDGPDDDCEVCGGEVTYTRRHDVPWTTQKNIFKAMSAFKAASLRRQAEGGEA